MTFDARRALSMLRGVCALIAAIAILAFAPAALAADTQTYQIATKTGVRKFEVETARTEAERRKGLMFRYELAEGRGMIFDFRPEQEVSMWMQNTFVPLDMIFIRANGQIHRIAENTMVKSEEIISSDGRVGAVLEVIAGTAKKMGIAVGDKVTGPLFNQR